MNLKLFYLLYSVTLVISLKTVNFEKTKIKAISMPEVPDQNEMVLIPQMNQIDCAYHCIKNDQCIAFQLTEEGSCRQVPLNQHLMKGHPRDPKAPILHTSEKLNFPLHFLLLHVGKIIEDFNTNGGETIDYPDFESGSTLGYIDNNDGTIYILNQNKMYLFSFDDKDPKEVPELILPTALTMNDYSTYATQNGIGYLRVQYETWIFKNNEWKQGVKFPYPDNGNDFELGCATFIPGNDNIVYHTGGLEVRGAGEVDVVYRYNIKDDSYDQPFNLPGVVRRHACAGFVMNGKEYVAVGGGSNDLLATTPHYYSLTDKTWHQFTPFDASEDKPGSFRITNFNGYFYYAGRNEKMWRMKIEENAPWEEVGDISPGGYIWAIPYNYL